MFKREINLYLSEFKESAIKLTLEDKKPIAQTASDLGIKKSTLYTWINKHAFQKALEEKSGTLFCRFSAWSISGLADQNVLAQAIGVASSLSIADIAT